MDYEKEIAGIVSLVPEDYSLAPETVPIATGVLENLDRRYGPLSNNPLEYHNAPHAVDIGRGAVSHTTLLYRFIPETYRDRIYDLDIVGSLVHDYEQLLGTGANERASGEYGVSLVEENGGVLNDSKFKERLRGGCEATTVGMVDGRLTQTKLQQEPRDPFKFILAFADKNGVAMEGPLRMFRDGTQLYYETCDRPTIDGLYRFLSDEERKFIRQGLNDTRVKSDIAYFFPDDTDEVYDVMREAYHKNIKTSHDWAVELGHRPELKKPLGLIARSVGVADSALLGNKIARMIRDRVA